MDTIVTSIEELHTWTQEFLETLQQKDTSIIVTLSGDLGAGKTTFVQHIAQHLNVTETITSPTFVIQKEYKIEKHSWIKQLIHIDAYRLENKEELEYLGWNELITNPHSLIFIEWPEMVQGIKLPNNIHITISINEDHSRTIKTSIL